MNTAAFRFLSSVLHPFTGADIPSGAEEPHLARVAEGKDKEILVSETSLSPHGGTGVKRVSLSSELEPAEQHRSLHWLPDGSLKDHP